MRAHGFRCSFTPLLGVLFTFPSRYWFAIGLPGVFSLAGWSRRIRAGFHVPRPTQGPHRPPPAAPPTGLSPAAARRSRRFGSRRRRPHVGPTTPGGPRPARFGLLPFRSPLLGESRLLSPPPATGMFRFAGFAPLAGWRASSPPGCPIREPRDQRPCAPPPGLSRLVAPFVASGSQGIHRAPCLTSRALAPPGHPSGCAGRAPRGIHFFRRRAPPGARQPLHLPAAASRPRRPPPPPAPRGAGGGLRTARQRTKSGEYRIRTDDPLLAKQVL